MVMFWEWAMKVCLCDQIRSCRIWVGSCLPELRLSPGYAVDEYILGPPQGQRNRTAGLVPLVSVLVVPFLAVAKEQGFSVASD